MDCRLRDRLIFGVDLSNVGNPVSFFNDNKIAYLAGNSVIVQNLETKKQRFVHARENFKILGVVASAHTLIVIEEPKQSPFIPSISIFSDKALDEENPVQEFEIPVQESISCVSIIHRQKSVPFALHKGSLLLAALIQTSDEHFTLFCWNKDGSLLCKEWVDIPTQSAHTLEMSFHRHDNLICIQSSSSFWLYRVVKMKQDWSLRLINFPLNREEFIGDANLSHHCWLVNSESTIVFGTDTGTLVVTEEGKVMSIMNLGFSVESLLGICSGFIVGGPDGACRVYNRRKDEVEFTCKNAFSIKTPSIAKDNIKLKSMDLSHSFDKVCAFLSEVNEIYTLDLTTGDDMSDKSFVQVACGQKDIHAMAICGQKILTAGLDRAVRYWDIARGEQRLCKYFTEVPNALAFHPSGLHVIILFPDEIRCVHLLVDDLRTFWEIRLPRKMCQICTISNGGHKFAIAHDNLIRVFNFYTGELSQELKGHNYRITKLEWRYGDAEIISIDEDGILYRWDIRDCKVVAECTRYKTNPHLQFTIVSPETLWILSEENIISQTTFEFKNMIEININGTSGVITTIISREDSSFALVGTKFLERDFSSLIQVYNIPYTGSAGVQYHQDFKLAKIHENNIFLVDSAGSLHVMELTNAASSDTLITQHHQSSTDNPWCDHHLVSEIHLEEKEAIIHDLTSIALELKSDHEYKVTMQKMKDEEEYFNLEEQYKEITCNQDDESKSNTEALNRVRRYYENITSDQESKYHEDLLQIENNHNSKLLELFNEHNDAKVEWGRQLKDIDMVKKEIIQNYRRNLAEIKGSSLKKLNDSKHDTQTLQNEIKHIKLELIERKNQVEEDIDTLIQSHKAQNEKMILAERQSTLKVAGENGILCKRTTALIQSIEDQKEVIKHLLYREESDNEEIKRLEAGISSLNITKKNREKVYSSKTKTSSRLNTRQEELTKFSVLDEKIKELNTRVSDDKVIKSTKNELAEKENILSMFYSEHADIEKLISFRQLEINRCKNQLSKQCGVYVGLEGKLESLKKELYYYTTQMNHPNELLENLSTTRKKTKVLHQNIEQSQNSECSNQEEDITKLESELKKLSAYLEIQKQNDIRELEEFRNQNQVKLYLIREKTEENKKSQHRLNSVMKNSSSNV